MMRSDTIRVDPAKAGAGELRLVGDRVSCLWNAANFRCRKAFLANEGVPLGSALERLMKDTPEYRRLPSDIAQETLKKLSEAWKSYFKLREKWVATPTTQQKPGLPSYRKDRKSGQRPYDLIPIKHPRSYSIGHSAASIVLPCDRRTAPIGRTNGRLNMSFRGRLRYSGKMGRAELTWDRVRRRWYMTWTVEVEPPKATLGPTAAVDLGVRIGASLSIAGMEQALHFENKALLHAWDYLGKEIAREQMAIAGTRGKADDKHSPHSRGISRLYQKRRLQLDHAMTTMAKAIAEHCDEHGVARVFLGWPKDIRRERNYGSRWNDRIHGFWAFDRVLKLIAYALENRGIQAIRCGERGSSSHCPTCRSAEVVRKPRAWLTCKVCSEVIHSDQAGSRNIAQVQDPSVRWDGPKAGPRTATQRWNHHRWTLRSANPRRQITLPEFLQAAE
jgi:transposase